MVSFCLNRKNLNFPPMFSPITSEEDSPTVDEKDLSRSVEAMIPQDEEFQQKQQRLSYINNIKPFQVIRLNKPNFEQ